MTNIYIMKESY